MSHVCRLTIRYRVPRAHLNTYTCAGTCEDNGEFKSCQDVHDTIKAATGQVPASGNYAVQGRTQLWKVFCEIDKDGGWLRLGIGENLLEESCKVPCFHCFVRHAAVRTAAVSPGSLDTVQTSNGVGV